MQCTDVRDLVDRTLDDGTDPSDAARAHLAACAECRRYAEEMTSLARRLADGARDVLLSSTAPSVDLALDRLREAPASRTRRFGRLATFAATAAAVLLAVAALDAARRAGLPSTTSRANPAPLTSEQLEAARFLADARHAALSTLSAPRPESAAGTYGQAIIDGPLTAELAGISWHLRSVEAFLLECIPMPSLEPAPAAPTRS